MFDQATSLEDAELPESFKKAARKGRPKSETTKQAISIRLSADVLAYFRKQGKGWQTRMDEVLKEYVKSHH
jgi:uncharacterized protein (DUF4415 family)